MGLCKDSKQIWALLLKLHEIFNILSLVDLESRCQKIENKKCSSLILLLYFLCVLWSELLTSKFFIKSNQYCNLKVPGHCLSIGSQTIAWWLFDNSTHLTKVWFKCHKNQFGMAQYYSTRSLLRHFWDHAMTCCLSWSQAPVHFQFKMWPAKKVLLIP